MSPLDIAAGLIALVLKIIETCQLDNDELKAKVEESLDRESDVEKAMDAYKILIGE
jgi:hypothetical protein